MKQKDWSNILLGILSIFAILAIFDILFRKTEHKNFTALRDRTNRGFDEDSRKLSQDYDAISGDLNNAFKSMKRNYESQAI